MNSKDLGSFYEIYKKTNHILIFCASRNLFFNLFVDFFPLVDPQQQRQQDLQVGEEALGTMLECKLK